MSFGYNQSRRDDALVKAHTPRFMMIGLAVVITAIAALAVISAITRSFIPMIIIFVIVGLLFVGMFTFVAALTVRDKHVVKVINGFKGGGNISRAQAVYVDRLMGLNRMLVEINGREIIGYNNDFCKIAEYASNGKINAETLKRGDALGVIINSSNPKYCLVISAPDKNSDA